MSLINDVLRELESRRAEGDETRSVGYRPPLKNGRPNSRRWAWWLLAAVVVGAALHLVVQDSTPDFNQPALHASVSDSDSIAQNAVPEPAQESDPDPAQAPESESSSGSLAAPSNDLSALTPETSIGNGVAESEPRVVQAEIPVAQAVPTDPLTTPEPAIETAQTAATPEADAQPSTIVIERADRDRDAIDDPFVAAQRSLARGRHALAETQLRQLTDTQPDHARARHLLASLLLDKQRLTAAVALLEDGLNRADPALAAGLLGRLLAEQGDIVRARQVLTQHAPAVERDPDYHLLLAAIERQNGDHQAAHDRYLAVTLTAPDRSTAWIGLGTSLESLDQPQAAREAYRQALNGRDRQAAAFARDRLNALPDLTRESP